jgi:hypothetical protein
MRPAPHRRATLIRETPEDERPRERPLAAGPAALSQGEGGGAAQEDLMVRFWSSQNAPAAATPLTCLMRPAVLWTTLACPSCPGCLAP